MNKIVMFVLLSVFSFAMADDYVKFQKGKYLYTVENRYNNVLARNGASSTWTKCSARIDFMHFLVEVGSCPIERISVYTKEKMWLGNFQPSYGNESFKAGYSYRDVLLGVLYYDIGYFKVFFDFTTDHATADNLDEVSCKKGKKKGIDSDGYAFCYSAYVCPKGQYAVDEFTCAKLPKGAVRLAEEGWDCPRGYEKHDSYDTSYCYVAYRCKKGEYAVDESTCEKLPKGAVRNEYEGWSCPQGYEKYDASDTSYCYVAYRCKKGEYAVDESTCEKLPKDAVRNEYEGWSCPEGYEKFDGIDTTYCYVP